MGKCYGSSRYYHLLFAKVIQHEPSLSFTDHRRQAESMLDGIDEAVERLKIIQSHTRSKGPSRHRSFKKSVH